MCISSVHSTSGQLPTIFLQNKDTFLSIGLFLETFEDNNGTIGQIEHEVPQLDLVSKSDLLPKL
jgi:hypothetical protein